MAQRFDAAKFNRELRAAQQRAVRDANQKINQINRENQRRVDAANRENQRRVNAHNQKVEQHNRRVLTNYNNQVERVNAHNRSVIESLNAQLRAGAAGPRYTESEQNLADRIHEASVERDDREWDSFLSYAKIDGAEVGEGLRSGLEQFGVTVWFDEIAISPGQSQALQMDRGLQKARVGLVLLTPAYLVGRFWTERELGALLHKETLIPILHGVTFDQVAEYSGILPDLAGFETARDSIEVIAEKIAAAILK